MLKYISHSCDDVESGEYWINSKIEKLLAQGYRVLNAGVNDRDGSYAYHHTVWAVMIKGGGKA